MTAPRVPLGARVQAAAARALLALPPRVLRALAGPPLVVEGATLDAGLQLLLRVQRAKGAPGLVHPDPATARARFRREMQALAGPPVPVRTVRDVEIPRAAGGPALRARHYAPPGALRPLVVYLHGGGHVIGDVASYDAPCRRLCADADVHVVSVDYRLAPEAPFPADLEDAHAALAWARAHAGALGADPARVAVGGDSAGGTLAAVVAREATRAGTPPFAQLLVYPPTDVATPWPSRARFGTGLLLTEADRRAFTAHYLGASRTPVEDPRISPLRAPDLHALPPALVVTAHFDLLRDEGEAYAAALAAAGTPARTLRLPDVGHGFVNLTGVSPAARRAWRDVALAWRALLEETATGAGRPVASALTSAMASAP